MKNKKIDSFLKVIKGKLFL